MNFYFYNPFDWEDDEVTKKMELTKQAAEKIFNDTSCWHQWLTYTGLNEVDQYCKLCGEKRDPKCQK